MSTASCADAEKLDMLTFKLVISYLHLLPKIISKERGLEIIASLKLF